MTKALGMNQHKGLLFKLGFIDLHNVNLSGDDENQVDKNFVSSLLVLVFFFPFWVTDC